MSLLRERNTCILCGDVLSSFHRPQEVSGAQPCDLSSLRFSCVFVDMSSSSTSEGTKRRRARAAELPTEGIELAVVGEEAPEGAGPSDGPPDNASSSGQPVAESQPQSSGPAVAVPEPPPPPPMQVGDGLETAGVVIEEASASEATDRVAVVLTPAPVPTKAMPALPAPPTPVKAMPSQPQHPSQPPQALGPRPPNCPLPGKAAGAQPSAIPKAGAAGRLRSLRLRGRFAIYRRLLRFHRLLPRGSVGRAYHRRGGSEAVSEEVRQQKEGLRQGADRPPTPRPPARLPIDGLLERS